MRHLQIVCPINASFKIEFRVVWNRAIRVHFNIHISNIDFVIEFGGQSQCMLHDFPFIKGRPLNYIWH